MRVKYRRAAAGVFGCLLVGSTLGSAVPQSMPAPWSPLESPADQPSLDFAVIDFPEPAHDEAALTVRRLRQVRGGDTPPRPQILSYVVQPDDSLWSIADQHDTDVETLTALNEGIGEVLQPGESLRVAAGFRGLVHSVRPGDTLEGIAATYDIPIEQIERANGIDPETLLQIDELIFVPDAPLRHTMVASRGGFSRRTPPPPAPPAEAEPASAHAQSAESQGDWQWPLSGMFTSEFGPRGGGFHSGLDIAVPTGTPAVASRTGTVVFAGWKGGYGYCVILDHGDGTKSLYAHASALRVAAGEHVGQGQIILEVGSTGNSTGPHLHFEIIVEDKPRNPRAYLPR